MHDILDMYPLTPMQEGMLFHYLLNKESGIYNEQLSFKINNVFVLDSFEKAINQLIERHDILRTLIIHEKVKRPLQVVIREFKIHVQYVDISEKSDEKKSYIINNYKNNDIKNGFNLSKEPPLRFTFFKLSESTNLLIWSYHHILFDGWSLDILTKELSILYNASLTQEKVSLPKVTGFNNYIKWIENQNFEPGYNYWQTYLKDFNVSTPLFPREVKTNSVYLQDQHVFSLDSLLWNKLNQFVSQNNISINSFFQTIWGILLQKYNNTNDIVFGYVVSGRPSEILNIETIVGLFINTLPIRIQTDSSDSFISLVKKVQLQIIQSGNYAYIPLHKIQSYTPLKNNLFSNIISFHNHSIDTESINTFLKNDFSITNYDESSRTNYDLDVLVFPLSDQLKIKFRFNSNKYNLDFIKRVERHISIVAEQVLYNQNIFIDQIDIITNDEKELILNQFNKPLATFPIDKTIHAIFEDIVKKQPDKIAITFNDKNITYGELNSNANILAYQIREVVNGENNLISILLGRSIEQIIGILAILKTNNAYVPIDTEYPARRIDYILNDSDSALILTSKKHSYKIDNYKGKYIFLDEVIYENVKSTNILDNSSNSLAYVIYTSGTTGKPKGVLVEHRNVIQLLFNNKFQFDFNINDVWTLFHSISFDFSVWEIFGSLLYGCRLIHIPKSNILDTQIFLQTLIKENVTILNQTPQAFYNLILEEEKKHQCFLQIRYVIFGGDALSPEKLKTWKYRYQNSKLINMYGITETTVHVTYKEVDDSEINSNSKNIGKSLPSLTIYILNNNGTLSPIGITGEIAVGGEGVARGYLNRPELTNERFIKFCHQKDKYDRIYKSGDLAVYTNEGELEYIGRKDLQVKIRGFRIELNEIEQLLLKHPNIQKAHVLANTNIENEKYICAYIVASDGININVEELRRFLMADLPEYMIPSYFIPISKIPLNSNGKIDKRNLPLPYVALNDDFTQPCNVTEQKLVEIWSKFFELEKISTNYNFFSIGGDSIKAIRLLNIINKNLELRLKIADLFTFPTIKELAKRIDENIEPKELDYTEIIKEIAELKYKLLSFFPNIKEIEDIYPMSDIEKGMIFHAHNNPDESIYHDQFVYNCVYKQFNSELFHKALNLMVKKHSILRSCFNIEDFDEFLHIILKNVDTNYNHYDISNLSKNEKEEYLKEYLNEDRRERWNITKPPLFRLATFNIGNDIIYAVWTFHHAILDGWSNASLITELNNTYLELQKNINYVPQNIKVSHKDFIVREIFENRNTKNVEFWKNELKDYKRLTFNGLFNDNDLREFNKLDFILDEEFLEKLLTYSRQAGTSLKTLCFTAYLCLFNIISYDSDLVVGVISNNRPDCEDGDKILGCFLNTLPFRLNFPVNITWRELLSIIDNKFQTLKEYDKITFFEIVKCIGEKNQTENPIFDSIFTYVDFHIYKQAKLEGDYIDDDGGLLVQGYERTNTLFDVRVGIMNGKLHISFVYSKSIISDNNANRFYKYYENILKQIVSNKNQLIQKIDTLSENEKKKLLYKFNNTDHIFTNNKTIIDLFEEQVKKTPKHIAIRCNEKLLSYEMLNTQSNHLAYYLRNEYGIKANDVVGLIMGKSEKLIISILGILKSGAAYLPLNPNNPMERLRFMIKDSKARVVLTDSDKSAVSSNNDEFEILEFFDFNKQLEHFSRTNLHKINKQEDLFYIIYTSGSTGLPKGVLIKNISFNNLIEWYKSALSLTVEDNVLLIAPISFDLAQKNIFTTLLTGSSIILSDKIQENFIEGIKAIEKQRVTIINCAPAVFYLLLQEASGNNYYSLRNLKRVVLGGESINYKLLESWIKSSNFNAQIINSYGPTECTDVVASYMFKKYTDNIDIIPIGNPINNVKIYILDKNKEILPIGCLGEIFIGGICLSDGYIFDQTLTQEKFIHNTIEGDGKIYKTGDMGRWLPNGLIEFRGRIDNQVKIRGFRIELEEIECQLSTYEHVKECVVIAIEKDNDIFLSAYYISEMELYPSELRMYLSNKLPDYMIPSFFTHIKNIPLTANGKVDRNKLPYPTISNKDEYVGPTNETEEKLVEIWSNVLNVPKDKLSVISNFFNLGGHSLSAIKIISRINNDLNIDVKLPNLFMSPTIKGLADQITTIKWSLSKVENEVARNEEEFIL